jgi:AcrR family transcriptional regulator
MPTDPKPTDRRVQRTQELLLDALRRLLMEQGYERLTIQEILDRAGVGRATFYAHYSSKDDLMASSIGRLQSSLSAAAQRSGRTRFGFSLPFFTHLAGHRAIYATTVGNAPHPRSRRDLLACATDRCGVTHDRVHRRRALVEHRVVDGCRVHAATGGDRWSLPATGAAGAGGTTECRTPRARVIAIHCTAWKHERAQPDGWALSRWHGGAGNRTRVRKCFRYGFYVCVPPIEVSRRWPVGRPRRDKSP